jgi:hypothetical protein
MVPIWEIGLIGALGVSAKPQPLGYMENVLTH